LSKSHLHQFLVSREFGGGAEIALQLAQRTLGASDLTPHVWVPGEGRAAEKVRSLGFPVSWYDGAGIFSRSRLRAGAANLMTAARLRASGRGLIHVHAPSTYGALRHSFRLAGVKRVLHIHLDFPVESLVWPLRDPPELIVTCARFLVDAVRQALPAGRQTKQRVEAVPNAVDLERFKPSDRRMAKQQVGARLDQPLLLMMANLSPHKGQETAVRAVERLAHRGIQAQLWLAGADRSADQAYASQLKQMIVERGLGDRVSLLGFRQDGPDLLRAADVVLLPSTSEGLPLTLLEAQACEAPVIAAPTAGIPEIIADGETGFLVPANDDAGYASRIESLLTRPELCARITSAAARHCRQNHSWDTYHTRMSELYAEVLAG
jgi:glycosyltransferase involved in cell wall biosynthesis